MVRGSQSQACQVCGCLTRCLGSRAMSASSSMGPSSLAASVSRRSLKRDRISCQVLRSLSSRSRVLYVLWNLSTHSTSYGTCQHTALLMEPVNTQHFLFIYDKTCQKKAFLMEPVNTQHFLWNLSTLLMKSVNTLHFLWTCKHSTFYWTCQHTALLMEPDNTQHFLQNLTTHISYGTCQHIALFMEPVNRQCLLWNPLTDSRYRTC